MTQAVLVVDDDPVQRRVLEAALRRLGFDAPTAASGEEALERLAGGAPVDAMLLDLSMPGLDGLGVLARMKERGLALPVIVQSANGSLDAAVSAMRAGACDFVVKPVRPERLAASLRNALKVEALEAEIRRVTRRASNTLTFRDLVTRSPDMARVIRLGERAAKSSIPVLLEGETGVGKEVIARAIQGAGDRRGRPFVAVNCGALPANLVESVLFGHEKGAFTGATDKHAGKFAEAHGGTLLLDEVGELPLEAQVKLLRVLQDGEVEPVGGRRPQRVDVRVISATHRSLLDLTREGRFREDLYYRLNVFPITVPPLRQRPEDVPELAARFLSRIAAEEGRRIRGFDAAAAALLARYSWPGNVRQLENSIFRAVVLAEGDLLTPAEFPQIVAALGEEASVPTLHLAPAPSTDGGARLPPASLDAPPAAALPAPQAPLPPPADPALGAGDPAGVVRVRVRDPNALALFDLHGEMRALEALEEEAIRFALRHYRGHMSEVSRRLRIGRSTLYRKIKDYGLDVAPDDRSDAA